MNTRRLLTLLVVAFAALSVRLSAEEPAASPPSAVSASSPKEDLESLVTQVKAKLQAGAESAEDLKPELAQFDALLAKYSGQKTDEVAEIAFMKALLYVQVFEDTDKGRELLVALKTDFAGTKPAESVDKMLARLDDTVKRNAVKAALIGKQAPEITFNWATRDGLKKLSDLKGKVVVLDFWATWCGPCVRSFPKVREEVAHFKGSPVVFLGVTSLQGQVNGIEPKPIDTKGDPAKETGLMPQFMKLKDMTWDVAFSDQDVFNPDYGISGIPYVAIIAPDGTVRHAGLNPLDPKADIAGKVESLLAEFKLPVPAKS